MINPAKSRRYWCASCRTISGGIPERDGQWRCPICRSVALVGVEFCVRCRFATSLSACPVCKTLVHR
jgi:hypothetical protein